MRSVLLFLSALLASLAVAVHVQAAQGGPDSFGYTYIDSNEPGGPTWSWDSIVGDSGTGTANFGDDDTLGVTIGFPFTYYGTSYTTAYVSDNMIVTFNGGNDYTPEALPNTVAPNAMIAGYWMDTDPWCGGTFAYKTEGASADPDQVFIVEYNGVGDIGTCADELTVQFRFYEADGCIEVLYKSVTTLNSGQDAAAGIENAAGSVGLSYFYELIGPTINDRVLRYCPPNDPPVAADDSHTVLEDTPGFIDVLDNDTDPEDNPLTITGVTAPTMGSVVITGTVPDQKIKYTPSPNVYTIGTPDTFTYTIEDTGGNEDTATVSVTIMPVNDAPTFSVGSTITVNEDAGSYASSWATGLTAGPNEATQSLAWVITHTNPTLFAAAPTLDLTGKLMFTPAPDTWGTSDVTLKLKDDGGTADGGKDTSDPALLKITVLSVNDPPTFDLGPSATADEDSGPSTIPGFATPTSKGPADESGQSYLGFIVTPPAGNLFSVAPAIALDGTLSFTPKADACTPTPITIEVRLKDDGGVQNGGKDTSPPKSFQLTLNCINDQPIAKDDTYSRLEDAAPSVLTVLQNDITLPDIGETLTIIAIGPSVGSATAVANGIHYAPAAEWSGTDKFWYKVSDGNGGEATAWVTVTVVAVNDPPVANDDAYMVPVDSDWVILDVTDNDTPGPEPEDPFAIVAVTSASGGTVVIHSATKLSYIPDLMFWGTDTFSYTIRDPGGEEDTAQVTITVPTPPVLAYEDPASGVYDVVEDQSIQVAAPGVLANDVGAAAAQLVHPPQHGTVVLAPDGSFTYTPHTDYYGPDLFLYRAVSGPDQSNLAPVHLSVANTNDPPTANPEFVTVAEDSIGAILPVLGNDNGLPDPPGETISLESIGSPLVGTAWIEAGKLRYTPPPNFFGADQITYVISDGSGLTASAVAHIHVSPVNDKPAPSPDRYVLRPGVRNVVPAGAGLLANDLDVDGDPLRAQLVESPRRGLLEVFEDGGFAYTPEPGYLGAVGFSYRPLDPSEPGPFALVSIDIVPNGLPIAAFSAPTEVGVGQEIAFIDNSVDPDGEIVEWRWWFGDGAVTNHPRPTHAFAEVGLFRVALEVIDADGARAQASLEIKVSDPADESGPGVADAGPDQTVPSETVVALTGNEALAWRWLQESGPKVVLHPSEARTTGFKAPKVTTPTTLVFSLQVYDGKHLTPKDHVNVTVLPPPAKPVVPTITLPDDLQVKLGDPVTLQARATSPDGSPVDVSWLIGGIGTFDGEAISFRTTEPGLVPVRATAKTESGSAFADMVVTVVGQVPVPIERIDTRDRGGGIILVSVLPGDLRWDLGDGTTAFGPRVAHTYKETGSYDVVLTAGEEVHTMTVDVVVPAEKGAAAWPWVAGSVLGVLVVGAAVFLLLRGRAGPSESVKH